MRVFPYNPMNHSYQTLKATFTAREGLLENMLKNIRAQSQASSLQHYLVVGPRGIGKTHFLRLIYFTIKEEKNSWLPLQFAEEEYGVTNLPKFCQRIILEIANELTDFGEKQMPADLEKIISELENEADAKSAVEKAISFLHQFVKENKKKLLILIDNIDLILGSRFMDELSLKRLRTFLMDDNTALLIGGSATIFKEVIGYDQPLYNLFQRVNLVELSQKDAVTFIRNWAEGTGESKITANWPAYEKRINSIYHLTGGNPRLLLFLFQIFTLGELPEVHAAFEALLDEITPYFKAKMETLSVQQREVMDSLAKMDTAASPSVLATRLKLKVNQLTAVIKTLVDNGYLRPIEKARKKGTFYYDVTEQLFRIWYQIRSSTRQKKRFACLLEFINLWYSLDELQEQKKRLESKYISFTEIGRVREAEMVKMHLEYVQEVADQKEKARQIEVQEWLEKGGKFFDEGKYEEAITCCEEALRLNPQCAHAWYNKGAALANLGRYEEALSCFEKALRLKPQYANVWYNKGAALTNLGRYEEALTCYEEALQLNPQDADAWSNKGAALYNLGQYEEAITCFEEALRLNLQYVHAWNNKGAALANLGRYEEALTCYKEALQLNPQDADAWNSKGWALYNLSLSKEAITCYEEALRLNPQYAYAWYNKGESLAKLSRHEEAMPCFDKARRYAIKRKELQVITRLAVRFYLAQITGAIDKKNIGIVRQYLDRIIELRDAIEVHKIPEQETGFNQLLMDFFVELLKKKQTSLILELIEILEQSKISKQAGFLFPLKILAEYLDNGDEDILNCQRPEIKGIIKEVLCKISS